MNDNVGDIELLVLKRLCSCTDVIFTEPYFENRAHSFDEREAEINGILEYLVTKPFTQRLKDGKIQMVFGGSSVNHIWFGLGFQKTL